jgi:hypothetical protein
MTDSELLEMKVTDMTDEQFDQLMEVLKNKSITVDEGEPAEEELVH